VLQVSVLNPDGSVKEVVNTKNIMIATGASFFNFFNVSDLIVRTRVG
jgi:hypothetical protein